MSSGWYITSSDIKKWTETNKRRAEELLPTLISKLIHASCKPKHLHFPCGDSVSMSGFDGTLEVEEGNEFIPSGKSIWEFGTNSNIKTKADSDYQKRKDNPGDLNTSETTFVFVTSRTWQNKDSWCASKNKDEVWRRVRGINADDLESWLQQCPGVHRWFANLVGKKTEAVWDIEQAWASWKHGTSIPATPELVLNGRNKQSEELLKTLRGGPAIIRIKAISVNEAYAFILATLMPDEELAPRALTVKDQNQWDILLDIQNTLILIPQGFIPANIGYAKQKGHVVVIPVDSIATQTASKEIELKKMFRDDMINALQSMGLTNDQAEEIYSDTRGYLGPIRRHKVLGPQDTIIPVWCNQFDSNILVTVLLATEWDSKQEKDKEAISQLAAIPYEELEQKLSELALTTEPPVRLIGSVWQVVSKIDLWSLIAHKINKQLIERLEIIIFDVLGETDPSYDLPPEDRWMANIKGTVPEYSKVLKSGIANTMSLLAVFGDSSCKNLGEIKLVDHIAYWVKELLNKDTTARGWYSFGSNLAPLAEAAPESFLQALESSFQGTSPPIAAIFVEGGDFGGCPHANLLWAIETISWNLNYLPRVTRALARLSEIDPGGTYRNRPLNSLINIYLGWLNNTSATHEERLKIIDANLIKFYPYVAWKLLISLLPEGAGEISIPIHKPNYRDWAEGIKIEVARLKYFQYLEGVADRLLSLVNEDPKSRWPELIENIDHLPKKHFYETIEKLSSIDRNKLDGEVRHKMVNILRKTISSHRKFKDAHWALPKEDVDRLEAVFNFIVPENPILKNKYLFDEHYPHLINPLVRRKIDNRKCAEIIEKCRRDAIDEIYQKTGIDGIKQLVNNCDYPGFIGYTIAMSDLKNSLEFELLNWLDTGQSPLITTAQSFVLACANIDRDWVKAVLVQSVNLTKEKLVNILLALPFDQKTFEILNKEAEDVKEKYWARIRFYILDDKDLEKINWVVEQLLINGRPLAAINAATQILHNTRRKCKASLDCKLLSDALKKIALDPIDIKNIPISDIRHDILDVIEYLQEQELLTKEEIVQIEWMYLRIFRFESVKPKYLEKEITENPLFFAHVISWLFKSDDGKREAEDTDEESVKIRAENAWELLNNISVIPGQQEDGSIKAEKLKEWVHKAREELKLLGRKKICDSQIGRLLSNSPSGTDEIWPHETVRELIEEVQSPELERGLKFSKMKLRGGTSRSLFEGGRQERELADKYREHADILNLKWPRTSEILRSLERSYEHDADWQDRRVELKE
ncbi:MAG: hypothetical protein QY310_14685 [Candidatus Jettenia sp. CY-1]|nr:MAG: hypothetical protein QY310_14685 [Candidatus Jettenia sp. CY-1]